MASRIAALLMLVGACGFPRPGDLESSRDASGDSPRDAPENDVAAAGTIVHVSSTGDDANDGLILPVKTVKHAIGIAAGNTAITTIALASGRYSGANGETFPYTVPRNVIILGPAGGGAILIGTKTEPGLLIDAGAVRNLEFEDFETAMVVTGASNITNIRVRSSAHAVRGETTAQIVIDTIDIAGTAGSCATGVVLNGAAGLMAKALTTRALSTSLDAKDQSMVSIQNADITGDSECGQPSFVFTTNSTISVMDSVFDGGLTGISMSGAGLRVSIVNSIFRNHKEDGIAGSGPAMLTITGGQILNNKRGGAELFGGNWNFSGVAIKQNAIFGVYLEDGRLAMRECLVTGNGEGIYLLNPAAVDLGTTASSGNNTLQNNSTENLFYDSSRIQVEAVGNTWNPGVQDANEVGRYPTAAIVNGPIPHVTGQNYGMSCDFQQCTLHR